MSTYILGFTPDTDKDFQRHKKILLVCLEGKVSLPPETAQYFDSDKPHESLLDEKLEINLKEGVHYEKWSKDMSSGFEVDLSKLPPGVTKLRFVNSW